MGAPRGNQNASGSRKAKGTRYQNISTMVTSVLQNGNPRTLKPRMIISLSDDDVQETIDAYEDPDRNPFKIGLIETVPDGSLNHPEAPDAHKKLNPEQLKEMVSEGTIDDIERFILSLPDTGGIQTMHRVMIDLGDTLNKKRRQIVEDLVDARADDISTNQRKISRQYEKLVG